MTAPTESSSINNLQKLLKWTFTVLPIAAGLDKFFYLLVDWGEYFPDWLMSIAPFSLSTLVVIVGIIEIVAGLIVLTKTEIGAYIVCLWLALIALILITGGNYLDIAVRDIVMAIAAFVLARMTHILRIREPRV